MAVNWNLGLQQSNPLVDTFAAFQQGRAQAGQRTAAQALASGNPQGALDAYAKLGDVQGVERINEQQRQQGQRERDRAWEDEERDARRQQWGQQEQERARGDLLRIAGSMRYAPPDQRIAQFQREGAPMLASMGVPPEMIQQIAADGISDQELDQLTAMLGGDPTEFQPQYQPVQGQNGELGYFVRPQGAVPTYETIRPGQADPNADLERQLLEAQVEAQRALVGQRQRSNIPRPAGGGGGQRGGQSLGSTLPTGWKVNP